MKGVLRNIRTLYQCSDSGGQGSVHPCNNAAIAWDKGIIEWVGPERELPEHFKRYPTLDAIQSLVVPGLIDCHTHTAFGGWRGGEFEERIRGRSYADLLREGRGILSTVKLTRALSEAELQKRVLGFIGEMAKLGVTTVECKSGYGLSVEEELKILRVYRNIAQQTQVTLISTLLAAHAVPPEWAGNRSGYLEKIIHELLPIVSREGLASFCDIFVEEGTFSADDARVLLTQAARKGLRGKIHADQITDTGGASLAAELGALSADHLEKVSEKGIEALARHSVVGVLLPFASLYLNVDPAPGRRLVEGGVRVALATDFNPGSAPSYHLHAAMLLGCTLNRLTPSEVLKGVTCNAAIALGCGDTRGSLEIGKCADIAVIEGEDVNQWIYHLSPNPCVLTIKGGNVIYSR